MTLSERQHTQGCSDVIPSRRPDLSLLCGQPVVHPHVLYKKSDRGPFSLIIAPSHLLLFFSHYPSLPFLALTLICKNVVQYSSKTMFVRVRKKERRGSSFLIPSCILQLSSSSPLFPSDPDYPSNTERERCLVLLPLQFLIWERKGGREEEKKSDALRLLPDGAGYIVQPPRCTYWPRASTLHCPVVTFFS